MESSSSSSSPPRRPRSAYNLFFRDEQANLRKTRAPRSRNGEKAESSVRVVASMWNNADASVKAHYMELAKKDKNRYALEVVRWKQEQEKLQKYEEDEVDLDGCKGNK